MGDFTELLQEAEKLAAEMEGTSDLPKVERSLRQVLEASNELYTRVAQTGTKDIQANLLLGSKGIDLPKIVQKLECISSKRTCEPAAAVEEVDLNLLLENELQNCIMGVIDEEHKQVMKRVYKTSWEHQAAEWKQEKRKILNAMIGPSGSFIELGKHKSFFMDPPPMTSSHLGLPESVYAAKIIAYNCDVSRNSQKTSLLKSIMSVVDDFKDAKVKDMWEIMRYMLQLPPFPQSEDVIKSRYSKQTVEALVNQAKKYLEDRYKTFMNNIINENLMLARRGGSPGTYPLVRSYVAIRLPGEYSGLIDGLIEDRPFWPMVYYCLRSGDIPATIYCLKFKAAAFEDLINLLDAKMSNASPSRIAELEANIRFSYRRSVRNETDPYKRIVYSVLGCCDIADEHSEVARTADDYLWLKFCLVRADYDKDDHIKYNDLQRMILEDYGESHYDALNQPHLYFQVLALTGQFEAAIEFLARIERYRVHGVHMAIVLNEIYMLAGPHDTSSPLIFIDPGDIKPARRLNLARLIMIYVRKFETTNLNEALHYYFLLKKFTDTNGDNLFKTCVTDLAIETKQYEQILGKVQVNTVRSKGLIDQFHFANLTAEMIAQSIGDKLVKKGLFEEAIDLYDIAGNQEEVFGLFCTLLSQVVHLKEESGSTRDRLREKAFVLADRYAREGYNASANLVTSFLKLKDLTVFFDYYHSKQFPQALKALSDLQIIPLQTHELEERIQNFSRLNVDVCKIIPDILLATMNIIFSQYQKLKQMEHVPNRYQDTSTEAQLSYLRNQAKLITNFTGMLPYRLPGDTNSRLVQMEILMH